MKRFAFSCLCLAYTLAGCVGSQTATSAPTLTNSPDVVTSSLTQRVTMLPTWTPRPTSIPKATLTPRYTSLPLISPTSARTPSIPAFLGPPLKITDELLLDRPTYSQLARPVNLVTLHYDPTVWSLTTFYPTSYMGYSLNHKSIYDCRLEPSVGKGVEGSQVEHYRRTMGSTTFEVTRVGQSGVLTFANYCMGEGQDYTCYQVSPGVDHAACTQAAEAVLATFKLIPNPFIDAQASSPNHWQCQDQAGTSGLCQISYSVPLNALAFTADGQAWAAGDDGILYHRLGSNWSEDTSPATHPLYDLSFSNPSDGWAVGAGAQVLHWDGTSWSEVLPFHGPGEGPGGSTQTLFSVDAYSSTDAWMVGAMKGIDGKSVPYALHWDGKDLIEQNTFPPCNCSLNAVLSLDKDSVFAVGGSDLGAIAFHWDGSTWSQTLLPGADRLYTLNLATDGTLWSAGIEVARDQSDTRGVLFLWDGITWVRIALPPLTGGVYSLAVSPQGQITMGGDFTALRTGLTWQPILTDITGYGWITDIETDPQGDIWALTRSGNLFRLVIKP